MNNEGTDSVQNGKKQKKRIIPRVFINLIRGIWKYLLRKPVILLCIVLFIMLFGWEIKGNFGLFGELFHGRSTEKLGMIREEVVDIVEMAVLQYNYTQVVERTKTEGFLSKEDRTLYTYDGEIKLGIKDCNEISIDISEKNKYIQVTLPEIEIIDHNIDLDSYHYYLGGKEISREERTQEEANDKVYAEKRMESTANYKEQASDNLKSLLEKYINKITDNKYKIEFSTRKE